MQIKHKKICIVSISLGKGGVQRSVALLSRMLENSGYEVHLVLLNNEIDYPYSGKLFNLGRLKKRANSLINRFMRFKKLRRYFKNNSFDLIIDHRPKNDLNRELFYSNYLYRNLHTVYVIHSSNTFNYFSNNVNALVKLYNKNRVTVAVSNYINHHVTKELGVENCTTIHNAFDPQWKNTNRDIPNSIMDKSYILTYGRIVEAIKDFTFLIDAYNDSQLYKEEIHLVIMGEGLDSEKLKNYVENLNLSNFITFLPFHKDPFSIIKNAKFVTLTSKYEGFPMVLVESLSVGIPVVALDIVSGPNEIIKHKENGLLIKQRSIPLFSEAMKNMCLDVNLYERCKANATPSVEKFSMNEISKKWQAIIENEKE